MAGDAIISIRPRFAEAILAGQKSVELRRRIPALDIGTRLWIYATKPTAAVVGYATVSKICRSDPTKIWQLYSNRSGVTEEEFNVYFDGTAHAIAILLTETERTRGIDIRELREMRKGFHPPQVISFISDSEREYLISAGSIVVSSGRSIEV